MLYNHSYNSKAKDEFSGAAVISVDPGKAEMLEVKIQRSPEPLMCAADVDFYPLDLLRETTTGSRSWFCLGRPRKISMGVKSLTDEGMASTTISTPSSASSRCIVASNPSTDCCGKYFRLTPSMVIDSYTSCSMVQPFTW